MTIPWWVASLVSNAAIISIEFMNRVAPSDRAYWEQLLTRTGIMILIAQWGLFYSWSHGPSWLIVWTAFTLGNAAMRTVAVAATHGGEVGSWWYTLLGVALMVAGSFAVKQGAT